MNHRTTAPEGPATTAGPLGLPGTLAHALAYAARGWHVFPLRPDDKRPAVADWENKATVDPDRITRAWAPGGPYSQCGIGIACGPSGLVVVDLDTAKGEDDVPPEAWALPGIRDGADVLADLYDRNRDHFPFGLTPTARTGSGGLHLYFAAPGREVRNSASKVGWKVDVRAAGGYVVAPPSTAAGRPYLWEIDVPPLPLPGWLLELAAPRPAAARPLVLRQPGALAHGVRSGYAAAGLRGELQRVLDSRPGTRNNELHLAAFNLGTLVGAGSLDPRIAAEALVQAGQAIGLGPGEVEKTVTSGLRSGASKPRRHSA